MEIDAYPVSLAELNVLAARYRRKIVRPWVAKYVRLGLLPPQNKPGLGKGKGKPSHYTQALANQLVPLIQAIRLRGKNLNAVGWDLWWYGWYAEPHYWREFLFQSAKSLDLARIALTPKHDEDDHPFQIIREIGNQLEAQRSPNPMIGSAQRHHKGEIGDLLSLVMGVFTGTYSGLEEYSHSTDNHERQKNEKLLSGTFRIPIRDAEIRTDGTHFAVSVNALNEAFKEMSGQFNLKIEDFIRSLSDEEINTARRELAYILWSVGAAQTAIQQQYRRWAGTKALFWATRNQKQQAAFLIGWLIRSRDAAFKEKSSTLFQTLTRKPGNQGAVPDAP